VEHSIIYLDVKSAKGRLQKQKNNMNEAILTYILPFVNTKYFNDLKVKSAKKISPKDGSLEEILINIKGKINKKTEEKNKKLEERLPEFELEEKIRFPKEITKRIMDYSLKIEKEKTHQKGYLLSVDYHETEKEEKIDIKITAPLGEGKNEPGYSFSISRQKEAREKPYEISIRYDETYMKESFSASYRGNVKDYMQQHLERLTDFASKVLFQKHLNIIPASFMGGILGYTYLGENFMARRDDLSGKTAQMVDLHEAIHTPDEYETRVLTSWILNREMPKYLNPLK